MNTNKSPLKAIKAHCQECVGCDRHRGGTYGTSELEASYEVIKCTDTKCQLYYYRRGRDERPGRVKRKLSEKHLAALQGKG